MVSEKLMDKLWTVLLVLTDDTISNQQGVIGRMTIRRPGYLQNNHGAREQIYIVHKNI